MNEHLYHPGEYFETPTQIQAKRLADLEARLHLANEAYFYLQADRNQLAADMEAMKRRSMMPKTQACPSGE